jgi:uncharacterized membrane protein YecN with MAPEG domain
MSLLAPVTAATAIVLALLFIQLAFAVIGKRRHHKVSLGSGQHADLEAAIRAHGNFAEYVPMALLLLLCAELNKSVWWLLASAAIPLVVGRYIHATAIAKSNLTRRVLGMQMTFASLVMGVFANVGPLMVSIINLSKH